MTTQWRVLCVACLLFAAQSVQAQSFTVLYNFGGTHGDGDGPEAGLIQDAAGNFYGTTSDGGVTTKCGKCGTVFKLDAAGNETVLHSFGGTGDGAHPYGGLVQDAAGNLYGTTRDGGASNAGTVFKLNPTTRKETVLHSFTGGADGAYPVGGLIRDGAGNIYGTTFEGGAVCNGGCGTVFKLDANGKETVLHSFTAGADGAGPTAGLIQDAEGNLYGTTEGGGASNVGTIFKLDNTGTETVLYSFAGGADGAYPYAGLVRDKSGNLYGTTIDGGSFMGSGTVFKLDSAGNETVVHAFNRVDGWNPIGGLILDKAGNLYGTTSAGGPSGESSGTVFKVDTTGAETVLYGFSGNYYKDPGAPLAALIQDAAGNLYSTAFAGGTFGGGIVFKLTTSKSTTSTSLISSLNSSTYGQNVTWTSTVASSGSVMPTGIVKFQWQHFTETTTIGSATLNSSGVATLTRSNLNADTYPLVAVYAGDAANLGSTSAVVNQVVLETTSSATLTSSPNPSAQGQAVTFLAKISSPTVIPTGPVTFTSGKTVLGTAQLSGGTARFTISFLPVGSTQVTATFNGDSNIAKSSASVIQTVQ